ncbi:spermine oxidase-like [Panonychus citri]|uniref:spermine oxidase-like n=1 Tax=Panonychus citri TaxID=50023 RepID=UPI002307B327|nr:spermine oxidase-like [Panonychus citri]
MEVAIIGAGISGLAAAVTLVRSGFERITIYEAQDYIGGRIKSIKHDDGYLELGAQWVHGQEGNKVFEMASQRDLIAPDASVEGEGHFCTQNGQKIDYNLVNQVIIFLDTIKTSLSNGDYKKDFQRVLNNGVDNNLDSSNLPDVISVGEVFRTAFGKWIAGKKFKSPQDAKLTQGIFDWFIKFESIDNSCSSLDQLSAMSYANYHECDGVPLNNFKSGYSSFINSLVEDIPQVLIKTSCPISQIIYPSKSSNNCNQVTLILEDGSIVNPNHVIITNPIGFLKNNMDTFFQPQLPLNKRLIISTMGFDSVNKIYMVFEKPFWQPCDLGFQLIWCNDNGKIINNDDEQEYPPWVYDVSGIDTVYGQPNILVAWIGRKGAELIEKEDDQSLITIFHSLLTNFLSSVIHHNEIPKPVRIIRSAWYSNNYICGSYSHRTVNFAKLNASLDELTKPLTISYQLEQLNSKTIDWPLVLFAGEATEEKYFSTTHGALLSGIRESNQQSIGDRTLKKQKLSG